MAAPKFKITKMVTLPLLKQDVNSTVFFKFTEPMKIGKKVDDKKDEAVIAVGIDLESGEPAQYLVPAVVQGVLHDNYGAPKFGKESKDAPTTVLEEAPEGQTPNAYVGKSFMITKHPKKEGKIYFTYTCAEIEIEEEEAVETPAKAKAK